MMFHNRTCIKAFSRKRKIRQTLAHILHKNCPPGVESLVLFDVFKGITKPQTSQGRVSFLLSK